jgi:hypothetical protein
MYPEIQMKRAIFAITLLVSSFTSFAAMNPPLDVLLSDLSRCDSTFFKTLKSKASEFSSAPGFTVNESAAYFRVPNRFSESESFKTFPSPFKVGSFEATAYFDELWSMKGGGKFVAWGFVLHAPIREVINGIHPLLWESGRVRPDGEVYVRSELWDYSRSSLGWQEITTEGGVEPKVGTVERVLLIEPYERDQSQTRFGCSLQGSVTKGMIDEYRPDIQLGK